MRSSFASPKEEPSGGSMDENRLPHGLASDEGRRLPAPTALRAPLASLPQTNARLNSHEDDDDEARRCELQQQNFWAMVAARKAAKLARLQAEAEKVDTPPPARSEESITKPAARPANPEINSSAAPPKPSGYQPLSESDDTAAARLELQRANLLNLIAAKKAAKLIRLGIKQKIPIVEAEPVSLKRALLSDKDIGDSTSSKRHATSQAMSSEEQPTNSNALDENDERGAREPESPEPEMHALLLGPPNTDEDFDWHGIDEFPDNPDDEPSFDFVGLDDLPVIADDYHVQDVTALPDKQKRMRTQTRIEDEVVI